jgi:hypothetical protein
MGFTRGIIDRYKERQMNIFEKSLAKKELAN